MKKLLFTSLCLMLNHTVFAEDSFSPFFSEKAVELIDYYRPISAPDLITGVTYRPTNKEKHYTEEYRLAWEELFRDCIINNPIKHNFLIDGIASALVEIASTNTIPMLKKLYIELINTNTDIQQEKQRSILNTLIKFNNMESLDAIFSLLDLSDITRENNTLNQTQTEVSLRELIWQDMLIPKQAMVLSEQKKRNKQAEQWLEKLNIYENQNLSEKNKMFMEKTRNLSRKPEEQNADISLP